MMVFLGNEVVDLFIFIYIGHTQRLLIVKKLNDREVFRVNP